MDTYSDLIVARGVSANKPASEIDTSAQLMMQDPSLSLRVKGLFTLLLERAGEPHNLFEELYESAEVIHVKQWRNWWLQD